MKTDEKLRTITEVAEKYLDGKLGWAWLRDALNEYIGERGHDDDVCDVVNLRMRRSCAADVWLAVNDEGKCRFSEEQMERLRKELNEIAEFPRGVGVRR